jgi:hypothetical protein
MAETIRTEKEYAARRAAVLLSLAIGEGQFGRTDVLLDDTRLIRASGDMKDLRLGPGNDLVDKKLTIRSLVVDVNSRTSRMSVSYRLKGGPEVLEFTVPGRVTSEGGLLVFETTVDFIAVRRTER